MSRDYCHIDTLIFTDNYSLCPECSVYMSVYVCVCMYVCVCVYVGVCVCMCVYVCM